MSELPQFTMYINRPATILLGSFFIWSEWYGFKNTFNNLQHKYNYNLFVASSFIFGGINHTYTLLQALGWENKPIALAINPLFRLSKHPLLALPTIIRTCHLMGRYMKSEDMSLFVKIMSYAVVPIFTVFGLERCSEETPPGSHKWLISSIIYSLFHHVIFVGLCGRYPLKPQIRKDIINNNNKDKTSSPPISRESTPSTVSTIDWQPEPIKLSALTQNVMMHSVGRDEEIFRINAPPILRLSVPTENRIKMKFQISKPVYRKYHSSALDLFRESLNKIESNWSHAIDESLNKIRESIKAMHVNNKPVVVFIHGFNNTTNKVKERTKLIDRQIGTTQVITFNYEWKSAESIWKYKDDQETCKCHAKLLYNYFCKLLDEMKKYKCCKLFIVCHSMGNFLLYQFLLKYIKQIDFEKIFKKLRDCQIISVAADCDRKGFQGLINEIMREKNINKYGIKKWTHYYNKNDWALSASINFKNNWKKSAGMNEIDNQNKRVYSIDCSDYTDKENAYFSKGHSYIDRKEIIADIRETINGRDHSQRHKFDLIDPKRQVYKMRIIY